MILLDGVCIILSAILDAFDALKRRIGNQLTRKERKE